MTWTVFTMDTKTHLQIKSHIESTTLNFLLFNERCLTNFWEWFAIYLFQISFLSLLCRTAVWVEILISLQYQKSDKNWQWSRPKDTERPMANPTDTKTKTQTLCNHKNLLKYSVFEEILITWRKWTWSCVSESGFISMFLLFSSLIFFSRASLSSARLTAALSWSLISCFTSERRFSMERICSVKILSLSSTAVCAGRC